MSPARLRKSIPMYAILRRADHLDLDRGTVLTGQSEKICGTSANPRVQWFLAGWDDD